MRPTLFIMRSILTFDYWSSAFNPGFLSAGSQHCILYFKENVVQLVKLVLADGGRVMITYHYL